MSQPLVSIVMTAFNRANLLQGTLASIATQTYPNLQVIVVEDGVSLTGETEEVCFNSPIPIEYYCRRNRPKLDYSNPAIPKNIGIRKAAGEFLIIQCGEVRYKTHFDVAHLVKDLMYKEKISNFALCEALDERGSFKEWYAHPTERGTNWFLDFCQASHREDVLAIGGFDEDYQGYGFDDDDFALRMQASGVKYCWKPDVVTQHQWHPIADKRPDLSEEGRHRYNRMKFDLENKRRGPVANEGRNWGDINS